MDKLKLVDNTEYDCSNSVANTDSIVVTLSNVTDFETLKTKLVRANITELKLVSEGGIVGVYNDFVKVSPYIVDGTNITVTFSKEDIQTQLAAAQETINQLEEELENQTFVNNAQDECIIELYEQLFM